MKFVLVCYLVSGIGLQRLENDRDVLSMCQIGLFENTSTQNVSTPSHVSDFYILFISYC